MSRFQIRYLPGTRLGDLYPSIRYPSPRGAWPTRKVAEEVRQQCFSADQMEVVEVVEP